jgi:hypothetical protein
MSDGGERKGIRAHFWILVLTVAYVVLLLTGIEKTSPER